MLSPRRAMPATGVARVSGVGRFGGITDAASVAGLGRLPFLLGNILANSALCGSAIRRRRHDRREYRRATALS
jgi:hypothetical protein